MPSSLTPKIKRKYVNVEEKEKSIKNYPKNEQLEKEIYSLGTVININVKSSFSMSGNNLEMALKMKNFYEF